jgi:hypothetical protein
MPARKRKRAGVKDSSELRGESLRIMLLPAEKQALIAGAKETGQNVSTMLRRLGLEAVGFLKKR